MPLTVEEIDAIIAAVESELATAETALATRMEDKKIADRRLARAEERYNELIAVLEPLRAARTALFG